MTNNQSTDAKKLIQQASQGFAEAQFNLGMAYYNGDGVPQDYAQAVKWFRLAADQGVASAQYNLALCYMKGEGVEKDMAEGHIWLENAAEQNHTKSQIVLGKVYGNLATFNAGNFFNSRLYPDAMVNCLKWFYLAWMNGEANAEELIKMALSNATEKEITRAQEIARNWKPKKNR